MRVIEKYLLDPKPFFLLHSYIAYSRISATSPSCFERLTKDISILNISGFVTTVSPVFMWFFQHDFCF